MFLMFVFCLFVLVVDVSVDFFVEEAVCEAVGVGGEERRDGGGGSGVSAAMPTAPVLGSIRAASLHSNERKKKKKVQKERKGWFCSEKEEKKKGKEKGKERKATTPSSLAVLGEIEGERTCACSCGLLLQPRLLLLLLLERGRPRRSLGRCTQGALERSARGRREGSDVCAEVGRALGRETHRARKRRIVQGRARCPRRPCRRQ